MKEWKIGDNASVERWRRNTLQRLLYKDPVVIKELLVINDDDYAGVVDSEGRECLLKVSWLDPMNNIIEHGVSCRKERHLFSTNGHLHDEDYDGLYEVNGVLYCGRCHVWMRQLTHVRWRRNLISEATRKPCFDGLTAIQCVGNFLAGECQESVFQVDPLVDCSHLVNPRTGERLPDQHWENCMFGKLSGEYVIFQNFESVPCSACQGTGRVQKI